MTEAARTKPEDILARAEDELEEDRRNPWFRFQCTPNDAGKAATALKSAGIDFDPARDMHLLGWTESYNDELNGTDSNHLREMINEYLDESDLTPMLPKGQYSLTQLHELLKLAQSEFQWHGFMGVTSLWNEGFKGAESLWKYGENWQQIRRKYPNLFPDDQDAGTSG